VIVAEYQDLVCAITFSGTADVQQSEELAHQTFINAWANLSQLKDLARFRPWLCTIARNKIRDFIAKDQRDVIAKAQPMESMNDTAADEPGPLESVIKKEHREIVSDAIRQIPEKYREPLVLYYRQQRSVKQVAGLLDVSRSVVKQRLQRGRKMIREQISSIVEESLSASGPKKTFTNAVIASITGMTIRGTASTGISIAASTNAAAVMSAISAKVIAAAAVAAIGIGAVLAYKQSTKPEPEPEFPYAGIVTQQQEGEQKNGIEEAIEQKPHNALSASLAETTEEDLRLEMEHSTAIPTEDSQGRSEAPRKEMAIYRGVVRDAAGNPIEGVTVRRYWYCHHLPGGWTDDIEATSNALGEYELGPLPVVERGNGILRSMLFEHPERGTGWFHLRTELSIILSEPSLIAGHVVDEQGIGIDGAIVTAILPMYYYDRNQANGHFEITKVDNSTVTTNAEGWFVFEKLPAGSRLHIGILKRGYENYDTTRIYGNWKYPIRAGQEDLLITLKAGGIIRGQLTLSGKPYQKGGIVVSAQSTGSVTRGSAITDKRGQFEIIGLSTKLKHTLSLSDEYLEGTGLVFIPSKYVEASAAGESVVEFELQKGLPVTIQIADRETGEGVGKHSVSVELYDPRFRQTGKLAHVRVADGRTNDGGQYAIKLTPNHYRLRTRTWKNGRHENLEQEFEITHGQKRLDLTIAVMLQPKVYGRLVDSNGVPIRGHVWFARRRIKTDEYGEFAVDEPRGRATDVYTCYAFDADRTLGRGFFWQRSHDVNDLEITLKPLAGIVGRLVDENGEGVASVKPEILIVPPKGRGSIERLGIWNTTVQADGNFCIEGIPTGLKMRIKSASIHKGTRSVPIGRLQQGKWKNIEIEQLQPGEVRDLGEVLIKQKNIPEPEDDKTEWNGRLSGLVTNEHDEIMVGFNLTVHYGNRQFSELTDINGRYEFAALPRNRKAELIVFGRHGKTIYRDSFEFICDGNDLNIQLLPPKQK